MREEEPMVTCLRGHQRLLTRHQPTAGRLGRTVLSSSGAFNTPQLLMLSGIGPRALLEPIGIPVRLELPGADKNLRDRYEVGVKAGADHLPEEVLNSPRILG